tara:strand:+ start:40 stop:3438 length:3399 start_codon:yes stop_codon:yes gene_type:complete
MLPVSIGFLIKSSGTANFKIINGVFNSATQTVDFRLKLVSVNLNVIDAQANFNIFAGTGFTEAQNLYGQLELVPTTIGGPSFTNDDGRTIEDFRDTTSNGNVQAINHVFRGFEVISNIDYSSGGQSLSFKAGATHEFGLVYYDHRNRHGGVQKIDPVDVVHFGDVERLGNEGRTEVDLRITHQPPYWATKYAPVYSKNTSYEKILQISVLEAALPRQETYADPLSDGGAITRPIVESLGTTSGSDPDGLIYLSLRSLEGKTNSYNESRGANLEYQYQEGDVLRVLRCLDSSGGSIRPMHEFKISSYKRYIDDEENPIKLSSDSSSSADTKYRRTGFFLAIRDQDIPGFSQADVGAGTDLFSNDCIVEIFRPKLRVENQVFHEIGKSFDIVTVGSSRTHGGDRSNTDAVSASIRIVSTTQFISSTRLFVGDKLTPNAIIQNSVPVFITGISPQIGGEFLYTIDEAFPLPETAIGVSASGNTVANTEGATDGVFAGCITLDTGDVHLKLREILVNPTDSTTGLPDETKPGDQTYKNFIIEDESVSDFFESKATDIGRPHVETPDQIEQIRSSSVTYSDPFALDSAVLALSSFNPSLFPFKDYNTQHGDVCYLLDRNEALMVMQENKVSKTPVSRVLIESASGGQLVTSTNVLGTPTYYAGEFGPGLQPESVVENFGRVYFVDIARGAVMQLSSEGIDLLSSKSMNSHFQTLFSEVNKLSQIPNTPCGYDPDNKELIVTSSKVDRNLLSLPESEGLVLSSTKKPASGSTVNADAEAKIIFEKGGRDTWDLGEIKWENVDLNWEVSGQGVIYLDKLGDIGSAYLDSSLRNSTDNLVVKAVTSNGSYASSGKISAKDGSLLLPTSVTKQSDNSAVTVTKSSTVDAVSEETSAYSTTKGLWMTFYSFVPELYAHLHDKFFSFKNGVLFKHNSNSTRNNFYGSQFNSKITVVSRKNPSDIKVYNAISIEGNKAWSTVVSNTTQSTDASIMQSSEFDEREGMFYRVISKDATASSTLNSSHKVVLGEVASVDGSKITFTSKVSNLPFGIGDTLFKLESSSQTTLSVTVGSVSGRKEITASGTVTGLVAGDTVVAVSDDDINGDKIRDYHAQVQLTNTDTTAVELYAVNLSYSSSPLHNDK